MRAVAEKTAELFPDDKKAQISPANLVHVEKGNALPPAPEKLRSLAKVYGENYELILYKAGYLDRNPFKESRASDHETLRDRYFDSLAKAKKRRPLSEDEKRSIEKMIENVMMMLPGAKNW